MMVRSGALEVFSFAPTGFPPGHSAADVQWQKVTG